MYSEKVLQEFLIYTTFKNIVKYLTLQGAIFPTMLTNFFHKSHRNVADSFNPVTLFERLA
jgi:hypothetical protein